MSIINKILIIIFNYLTILFITFVLIEISLCFATQFVRLPINYPTYSDSNVHSFWQDINKDFGVWHKANDSFTHKTSCFTVEYTSNSYGARDKEREMKVKKNKQRVIVLGDSFIEGFGVERNKRLSDLLEQQTGLEHLNFGTSGNFGTIQQAILYETLALKFDHNYVVIGMLPNNDFLDDSFEFGKKVYKNRYRPYYNGVYPNYKIIYFQNEFTEKFSGNQIKLYLRNFTFSYNVIKYFKSLIVYKYNSNEKSKTGYSGYYDYSQDEFLKARYSFEKIVMLANKFGKSVLLFTIPVYIDFIRSKNNKSIAPLNKALSKLSKEIGFEYLDLLPLMKGQEDIKRFFHSCDGHWSDYGHKFVSEILLENSHLYKFSVKNSKTN